MTRRKRIIAAIIAVFAVAALIACDGVKKQPPVPGRVAASGDSVLLQAMYYGNGSQYGWDDAGKIGKGWEPKHAHPRVQRDVQGTTTSPAVLGIAFGQNFGDVYGQAERNQLFAFVYLPHPDTCDVLVLPHYAGTNPVHALNLEAVRADLLTFDQQRPNTVSVDWRPIALLHPEYLDPDGVHLNPNSDGPRAFVEMIASGVEACGA